jgi:hypothetical protein
MFESVSSQKAFDPLFKYDESRIPNILRYVVLLSGRHVVPARKKEVFEWLLSISNVVFHFL